MNTTINPATPNGDKQPAEGGTYLNERNIRQLKALFATEEDYRYHMKVLWLLRGLAGKACEVRVGMKWDYDESNPSFPIWKTTNELIGCLLRLDGTHFDIYGNMIQMWR